MQSASSRPAPARRSARSVGSPEHAGSSRFLPHVQGLRAIAVLLVVLYHFWPGRLPGGYVGVDVFFVISGFLITSHLLREVVSTGTVRLGQFWARRARRLLPASLLVLLFCSLAAMSPAVTPTSSLPNNVQEIIASTFYVENWFLAITSADYLNHAGEPTMVQHYWSLSLEEQFYVVWPLLVLLAAWLAVTWLRGDVRRVMIVLLGVVSAGSFAFSVVFTSIDPQAAYFVTFTRMWEFGVGAAIALIPALRVRRALPSFLLGWAGIITLLVVAFRYDGQTPFPGWLAVFPVLGAAAIISAANTDRWWHPTRVLSLRPAQFVGGISYSLYLWHWPLIVIAPYVAFWGLTIYHRVALLVLCFVLAWLTTRFVENPARSWKVLTSRPPRVTLLSALAAMIVVAGTAGAAWGVNAQTYRDGVAALAALRDDPPDCFGAASVLDPSCTPEDAPDGILPSTGFARVDRPEDSECFVQLNDDRPVSCDFGSADDDAPQVILIGDSHAYQLLPTLERIADERGWRLTTYFKGACPWSDTPLSTGGAFGAACESWRAGVADALADQDPAVVFTAALATTPYASNGDDSSFDAAVAGYRDAWSTMLDRGVPIVTMVDNPVWETDPNRCLRQSDVADCAGERSTVLSADDPIAAAADGLDDVTLLDFTDVFCGPEVCEPVVGGANVYRDQDHITVTFADTLTPQFAAALDDAVAAR